MLIVLGRDVIAIARCREMNLKLMILKAGTMVTKQDERVSGGEWKVLAFLQNMWFKNPDSARRIFERNPDKRNQLIGTFLFMGCLTGRRLEAALGDMCDSIIWEECSKEIGGKSSAAFLADLEHMRWAITEHAPDVILAFGKIAEDALKAICPSQKVIYGPHPAARHGAVEGLERLRAELTRLKAKP